jgi:exoribonuclease-2
VQPALSVHLALTTAMMQAPADLHHIAVEAMRERGLRPAFAAEALQQAEAARQASPEQHGDIRDLRRVTWFSIDNDDTQDLDQLSVAEALPGGAARLRVAVADVDTLVKPGSPIDEHAAANTTSVYTAAGVFPMLPPTLSNDLTSLHEGRERLAVVVDMQVEPDGTVSDAALYRASVLNHAKLTYDAVAAWLDGRGAASKALAAVAGLEAQLRLHDRIAQQLQQWRQSRGALTVKTSQARPVFDAGGRLVDLRPDDKNRAKDLIADLMIATNGATARYLTQHQFPSLRRMLMAPRRWDRIMALAKTHGAELPPQPDAIALERFLHAQRSTDPRGFADLSLAVVKLLGSGEYAAEAAQTHGAGHFGLAVNDYAHSTAPNRRYPDLVTQRLIKAALAGEAPPYGVEQLADLARHCTLQEDNASKVERQVLKAAAAVLLHDRIGDIFQAIVTGASTKGTFVRIEAPMVEGRVVRGFEPLDVGDALCVRLVAVDAERSHIDFERA